MGPRRVSTTSNASGSWLLDEQCDAQRAGIWPIGPQFDPYWDNVSLLLHMDGSNGSTTFTDSSSNVFVVTANGDAQISTTQSKYGGASGYLDGSGDYLSIADDAAFDFGNQDFTIEFWLYLTAGATGGKALISKGTWPSGLASFLVYYGGGSELGFYASTGDDGTWDITNLQIQSTPSKETWHHVAITRSGNVFRGFFNGVKEVEQTYSITLDNNASPVTIGSGAAGASAINAYIDDLRITKGIARYTSNFTPPTAPFPNPPAPPNPIPALSPVLWYDFADESTVGVLESGEITQVTDKGSRGWTLTKSATGPYPYYVTGINGLKCLDWGISPDHDNFLYNSSGTPTSIGEVYVVVDAAFGGNATNFAGLLTRHNGVLDWYVLAAGQGLTQQSTYIDELFINGGTSNKFSAGLFGSPSIDNPAILCLKNSSGIAFVTDSGFQIGNDRNFSYLNRGWSGLIGEYVIFPSVLSPTDRDAVQAWLATKWGITPEGQGNG